jgi:cellulose biosynthesis protein BcsQ
MKSVAMFNNKGGVGKTTLLCNLAACLAIAMKKRILVVDCDPQCNTTQLIMGEEYAASFYWDDSHPDKYTTIADVLRPIRDGDSDIADVFEPIPRTRNRFNVDLIAGHPTMSFLEDKLSEAWRNVTAGDIGGYRKTNWARNLCEKYAKEYDVVLFDVGPSLGAINRSVLLGCDNFVTPMGTDIFSILGIRNIAQWLGEAIRDYVHSIDRCEQKAPGAFEKYGIPKRPSIANGFAGYTLNQYQSRSKGGEKVPTERYEEIIRKVPAEIGALLEQYGVAALTPEHAKLGDVPHLYSLIPLAQTRASPIMTLAAKDGIVGSQYKMVENYQTIVSTIATNFLRNIGEKFA